MNKAEKQQLVKELNRTFKENKSVWLIHFRGLNVPDATELRRKVTGVQSEYRVIKNRLALRAAKDTFLEPLTSHFDGPTAIVYTSTDPVALAKVLTEFAKENPSIRFKAGVLEGTVLSGEQLEELSRMVSREHLLSKVLFLLNAPLAQLAGALQSPLRDLASVLKQMAERKPNESAAGTQDSV